MTTRKTTETVMGGVTCAHAVRLEQRMNAAINVSSVSSDDSAM